MRRLWALVAVAALAAAVLPATAVAQAFVVNNGREPRSLDPTYLQGPAERRICEALFEGLVSPDPKTGRALPGVAETWVVDVDRLTITFSLRRCFWSDGTPVRAADFVAGWLRTLEPERGSENAAPLCAVVRGARAYHERRASRDDVALRALSDRLLEVGLACPPALVPEAMLQPAFVPLPVHTLAKFGEAWSEPGKLVGNGPFLLKDWKPFQQLSLVKNPIYWDARSVRLSSIKFLPIEDGRTAYNLYRHGEIDWLPSPPPSLVEEIRLRPDYQSVASLRSYYYLFNASRPPFDEVRLRRVFALAVDRKALVERVTKGGELPALGFVPPLPGYPAPKGSGFDPEGARRLLAEAGYGQGGKPLPSLTLVYNDSDVHGRIAEFLRAEWRKNLGVEVELRALEWKDFLAARAGGRDFSLARAGWIGDCPDAAPFLELFARWSPANEGLFSSARYDALLARARDMKAGDERSGLLAEAEALLVGEEQAVLPLFFEPAHSLIDTGTWGGWYANPSDLHPWKYLYRK